MDLQTRKINFIQEFLKLESEKTITHLEKLLRKESKVNPDFVPMGMEEFQNRIDQSSDDSKNGRLTQADDLLSDIEERIKLKSNSDKDLFKPMSIEELNSRIDQSEDDFKNNRFKTTSELLSKYK